MKRDVFKNYDIIADWFSTNRSKDLMEKPYLDRLIEHIPTNSRILDLGCGTGEPIYGYFKEKGYSLCGVDASSAMLAIARRNFPDGDFIHQDMRDLDLDEKFDAIIAWHSFFHLAQHEQRDMFSLFKKHLKTKGILLFTSGPDEGEAWGMNNGQNLYHASLCKQEYNSLLKEQGFSVIQHVVADPNCGGATIWLCQLKED
ncbi:class I SAM-dependent DNA methyltransferase [Sphingobacterium hotanense]|uniref:Class I SAM-dependent methyltransferase n=1 Tax=Sphingobacterium hotanense TaxID=649196 RepID=A0ABT7NS01_9SPHI|nr:class I SAM-dependent methyltransferase [Sphingobacterium hotanense]MDM1049997.1 class I SAM-dependent methyltransferase [Sphingobacterium hotanense]